MIPLRAMRLVISGLPGINCTPMQHPYTSAVHLYTHARPSLELPPTTRTTRTTSHLPRSCRHETIFLSRCLSLPPPTSHTAHHRRLHHHAPHAHPLHHPYTHTNNISFFRRFFSSWYVIMRLCQWWIVTMIISEQQAISKACFNVLGNDIASKVRASKQ